MQENREILKISNMGNENLITRKRQTFSGFVLGVLTTLTVIVSIITGIFSNFLICENISRCVEITACNLAMIRSCSPD